MGGTEIFLNLAVVVAVLALELVLLGLARRKADEDDARHLEELLPRLVADIAQRARHGHSPDWLRYQAEMERPFEPRDEKLRALASAALAAGLGGTIIALIVNILHGAGMGEDPRSLIGGMGVALFGSLAGVSNNLFITLRLLPRAEQRFEEASRTFRQRLQAASDAHPPTEAFTQTVKEELAGIRKALNQEFASAFSTAITGFPEVVAQLGGHMDRLAEVVEIQSRSTVGAAHDLRTSSGLVAESSRRLQPAVEQLATVSTDLAAMPQHMSAVLESHREAWIEGLRGEHEARWTQLVDLQKSMDTSSNAREREMLVAVGDVREAVDRLPGQLKDEINRISATFGNEFGREARHQVNQLSEELKLERAEILRRIEGHEQEWRNNIGEVVKELLVQVGEQVEDHVAADLRESATQLSSSTALLAEIAEGFAAAHREWREVQEASLSGWREASERIEQAAAALALGDDQLKVAVEALGQSADHLQRVARLSAEFEADLREALKEVSDRHLEDVRPIHGELSSMIVELKAARGHFDGVVGQQSDFIERLIGQIVRDRGVVGV